MRRAPLRHLQRTRGQEAPSPSSAYARRRARTVRRRGSSTPRRWRSVPMACCTSRAVSKAPSTASTTTARTSRSVGPRRRVRPGVCRRRLAVRRRPLGHDLPRRPRRRGDAIRVGAAERRGISSGGGPDDALRDGAHALARTTRSTAWTPTAKVDAVAPASAGRRVSRSTRRGCCTSSTRWPASSGLYRFARRTASRSRRRGHRARRRRVRPVGRLCRSASNDTVYRSKRLRL